MNHQVIGVLMKTLRVKLPGQWPIVLSKNVDFHWIVNGGVGLCLITINIKKDKSPEHKRLREEIDAFASFFLDGWIQCPALLTYSTSPRPFTTELRDSESFWNANKTAGMFLIDSYYTHWSMIWRHCRQTQFREQFEDDEALV
jgi:hypothetical protein